MNENSPDEVAVGGSNGHGSIDDGLADIDWRALSAKGSIDELVAWAKENHHVDLADEDVVLPLAANAILTGAWRNNSELEAIHVGDHKKRGQAKAGLSDPEMMLGNIGVAKTIRKHLAAWDQYWYFDLVDELLDPDRPYAADVPLGAHVTKVGLKQHRRQVDNNVYQFHKVADLVGRDRFLRGLALGALIGLPFWGSPLWSSQVDSWADGDRFRGNNGKSVDLSRITPDVATLMKEDPTGLPIDVIEYAVYETAIGFARGKERWHVERCGHPEHPLDNDMVEFLGGWTIGLLGIPSAWYIGAGARHMQQGNDG